VRQRVCEGLANFGIVLDRKLNRAGNARECRISASNSGVELWVIPLEEELQMARAAANLLGGRAGDKA